MTGRTTLLDLPLPVTGQLSGTWGDMTNNGLTQYLDIAIAGALSITSDVTLATTEGDASTTGIVSTTAQYRTLIVPASGPSGNIVITAPSSNRTYHVINRNATYTVQVRAGANSGVTLGVNQSATVGYDSVAGDYVLVGAATGGPTLSGNNAFTGANTFYNATGQTFAPAATNDGIIVLGRAGGSSSYRATLTPATLSASVTLTLPSQTATLGYINIPQSGTAKTTAYTLATSDVGEFIEVGSGGSIEIPNSTFSAGDAVLIFNNTSAGITITCTITTAYIAGTDTDKATVTLATRGIASILFASGTVCVISGNVS